MRIHVQGGAPLRGQYIPSGNSNAAIASIAASLLSDAACTITPLPETLSVQRTLQIAEQLGAQPRRNENTLLIQTSHVQTRTLESDVIHGFTPAILFLAPLLARRQYARFDWSEPLNRFQTHLIALRDLGLTVRVDASGFEVEAERWESRELILAETSVTGTALVCMLAATLGKKTTIYNAASEPHLRSLQSQLIQMGAQIDGIGSNLVTVYGVAEALKGGAFAIPFDHIEVASIAALGAMTPGQLSIHHINLPDLRLILKVYEQFGMPYYLETQEDGSYRLHIPDHEAGLRRADESDLAVSTAPWPGFPSDLIAMTTVLATQTRGSTLIHEKLFDNRLLFTDKLKAMGAHIVLCDPHRAIVIGKSPLQGEYMDTPDVRTGIALLAAAICAEGESVIDNAQLINRTFEGVLQKLKALGARIQEIDYE